MKNPDQKTRVSFFKNLLIRRVPQIVGAYLAASWIMLEFLDWLVNRYPISPYLVDFGMVSLASLIPTVVLIAYFHGKPGRDEWTRTEKIGIPTNIVFSTVLLIFIFQGKDLGATTTSVTLLNENGEQIERSIPKSEFRKNIALFPFENNTGQEENDWLRHAIPVMTQFDILQDMFINVISTYELVTQINDAGFQAEDPIPLTLKKKITGEHHKDFFTSGVIEDTEGETTVTISLYDQKTAKLISENTFSGSDLLGLVDNITLQLKQDLNIPRQHMETTEDLPVSEIMTTSIPALQYFFSGLNAIAMEDDWLKGIELLEKSVKEDNTFAFGYVHLYTYSLYSNQGQKVVQAFEPLMKHLYKLPERTQFGVKHDYYSMIKQDRGMAFEVAKNWAELYPDDLNAHYILALLYMVRNQTEDAITEYQTMLSLNPTQFDLLLEIGELYEVQGDFELASDYYEQYMEKFPNSLKAYLELGDLNMLTGNYEKAKSYYNEARLIEPNDLNILLALTKIDTELGNFQESLSKYNEALASYTTPENRYEIYENLEQYYLLLGQIHKSIEYMELKFTEYEKYAAPILIIDKKSESLGTYLAAGDTTKAHQVYKEMEAQMTRPPLDILVSVLHLNYYLEIKEVEKAEENLVKAKEAADILQFEILRPFLFEAQATIHELKGEYRLAIDNYLNQLELDPTKSGIHVDIGRCHRNLRNFKKAEEHIQTNLSIHPFHPETNYDMALVLAETGRIEEALNLLSIADDVWSDADPEYRPAMLVREKIDELGKLAKR